MPKSNIGILHYSVAPIIGGVEAVIDAHTKLLCQNDYQVSIIAGRGSQDALPSGADFIPIPLVDSQHEKILQASSQLEKGAIPTQFEELIGKIYGLLEKITIRFDHLIVHNVLTKHFNIPLTAALIRLLDTGKIQNLISWCHDITWTSPNSRSKVFPGYPWDLLRTYHPDITYITVSNQRQHQLTNLFNCSPEIIKVIYNGVDPSEVLGLSKNSWSLIKRLKLIESDLIMIMPVRVTRAKNIELALQLTAALKTLGCQPKLILTGPPDPHDSNSIAYYKSLILLRQKLGIEENMHFIYESGPSPDHPFYIDMSMVGELCRISDILIMPSHREGFGMPVLEAGLIGLPVFSTDFPAAKEIGLHDVTIFDEDEEINQLAMQMLNQVQANPTSRLKQRIRKNFTWEAIFSKSIVPILDCQEK